MAFTVDYSPAGLYMNQASQAGRGDAFVTSEAIRRQRENARRQDNQLAMQMRATEIQNALAERSYLAQQERERKAYEMNQADLKLRQEAQAWSQKFNQGNQQFGQQFSERQEQNRLADRTADNQRMELGAQRDDAYRTASLKQGAEAPYRSADAQLQLSNAQRQQREQELLALRGAMSDLTPDVQKIIEFQHLAGGHAASSVAMAQYKERDLRRKESNDVNIANENMIRSLSSALASLKGPAGTWAPGSEQAAAIIMAEIAKRARGAMGQVVQELEIPEGSGGR